MEEFSVAQEFVVVICDSCNVRWAMTKQMNEQRRNNHKAWYCPNCSASWVYTSKSDKGKLQEELESAKRTVDFWKEKNRKMKGELASERRRSSALRGVATKFKKRISSGGCPCCNRQFKNLRKHMQKEHPEYSEETK